MWNLHLQNFYCLPMSLIAYQILNNSFFKLAAFMPYSYITTLSWIIFTIKNNILPIPTGRVRSIFNVRLPATTSNRMAQAPTSCSPRQRRYHRSEVPEVSRWARWWGRHPSASLASSWRSPAPTPTSPRKSRWCRWRRTSRVWTKTWTRFTRRTAPRPLAGAAWPGSSSRWRSCWAGRSPPSCKGLELRVCDCECCWEVRFRQPQKDRALAT